LDEFKHQSIGLHMIDLGGDVCGNGISKLVFTILSAVEARRCMHVGIFQTSRSASA
jgi:hypothetical protein